MTVVLESEVNVITSALTDQTTGTEKMMHAIPKNVILTTVFCHFSGQAYLIFTFFCVNCSCALNSFILRKLWTFSSTSNVLCSCDELPCWTVQPAHTLWPLSWDLPEALQLLASHASRSSALRCNQWFTCTMLPVTFSLPHSPVWTVNK